MANSKKDVQDTVMDLSTPTATVTPSTITDDEVGAIRTIRKRSSELVVKLGQVRLEQIRINSLANQVGEAEKEVLAEYGRLVQQEQDTFKSLSEKYGDGSLDLETGTFTPSAT